MLRYGNNPSNQAKIVRDEIEDMLTVEVQLASNGKNACNIFLEIQEVNYFEICFKKFVFTCGYPGQVFLEVTTDTICVSHCTE